MSSALSKDELAVFRGELIAIRDRLSGKVEQMRGESLTRDDEVNYEEDGSDAFERLFSLVCVGNDQESIFKIDEALRSIEEGKYGVCEDCSEKIEKPRLQALPFAQKCIKCQSEQERMTGGTSSLQSRFR